MKAILLEAFGGPEVITFGETDKPAPSVDQILIEVVATSVNRPDVVQRQGNYHPPKGDSEVLGLEVAGVVVACGENVDRWKVGDRVFALIGGGGYAEYAVAYGDHAMAIPESMSFEEAACICETYLTAYLNLFMLGELKEGESVLLHGGGGGVNTAGIHLCCQLVPQSQIIVTASSGKVDRVASLGAHHVIDYQAQDFAEEVAQMTEKRGVDVILDHLGAQYLEGNMKSLAVYGRLVLIGVMGGVKAELNLAMMMVKRQQILGSVLRPRSVVEKADIIQRFAREVLPYFADRLIVPLVSDVFPLERAADAHRAMEASQHFGKIVLKI